MEREEESQAEERKAGGKKKEQEKKTVPTLGEPKQQEWRSGWQLDDV